jgi:hypothetical protein
MANGLLLTMQGLGIMFFTALTVLAVWFVCGAVFCFVVCGLTNGWCNTCRMVRNGLAQHRT